MADALSAPRCLNRRHHRRRHTPLDRRPPRLLPHRRPNPLEQFGESSGESVQIFNGSRPHQHRHAATPSSPPSAKFPASAMSTTSTSGPSALAEPSPPVATSSSKNKPSATANKSSAPSSPNSTQDFRIAHTTVQIEVDGFLIPTTCTATYNPRPTRTRSRALNPFVLAAARRAGLSSSKKAHGFAVGNVRKSLISKVESKGPSSHLRRNPPTNMGDFLMDTHPQARLTYESWQGFSSSTTTQAAWKSSANIWANSATPSNACPTLAMQLEQVICHTPDLVIRRPLHAPVRRMQPSRSPADLTSASRLCRSSF